jgi:DtxR family Mn-dependent transcriptional regulator
MPESESREMYLKSIYELTDEGELVAVSHLAKRVGVSPVSATEMVKRLESQGMIIHTPYKGVKLYDISCRLEHATDASVTEALAEYLEHPTTCVHGHPIPNAKGQVEEIPAFPLNEISCEVEVEVIRIKQPELPLCEYLEERGIYPGTVLKIIDEAPYNGPYTVELDGNEIALGREISARIFVNPID